MKLEIEFKTVEGLKQELLRLISDLKAGTHAPSAEEINRADDEYRQALQDKRDEATAEKTVEEKVTQQVKDLATPTVPTVEEVRAICQRLKAEKKNPAAVIHKYADSLSEVPDDKRAELLAELETL